MVDEHHPMGQRTKFYAVKRCRDSCSEIIECTGTSAVHEDAEGAGNQCSDVVGNAFVPGSGEINTEMRVGENSPLIEQDIVHVQTADTEARVRCDDDVLEDRHCLV